jgi:dihydrofolate reductase
MRKVVYSVGVSLDGYIADQGGGVEWLERATSKAKGEDFGMTKFFKSIDTVLMGRKTYEIALKMGMAKGGYPGMKNYIFSRSLPPGERSGVEFVSPDITEFVTKLKQQKGKKIWLCGGGELAREFLKLGLLDEIGLGIVPWLVGAGIPALPSGFAETELELTEVKQFKGGVVALTYSIVAHAKSGRKAASGVGKTSSKVRSGSGRASRAGKATKSSTTRARRS